MQYKYCGKSGVQLPLLSLGLWHNFGDVDDFDNARRMILHAFEKGICHYDLANNYGPSPGSAERNFGRVLKSDVNIAKNYLSEKQIRQLERAVSGYFDYIEDLIEREIAFNMEQFAASVNEFLEFRRYDILDGNGKVSRDQADEKAFGEYEIFNRTQKIDSDFDKVIRKIKKN